MQIKIKQSSGYQRLTLKTHLAAIRFLFLLTIFFSVLSHGQTIGKKKKKEKRTTPFDKDDRLHDPRNTRNLVFEVDDRPRCEY